MGSGHNKNNNSQLLWKEKENNNNKNNLNYFLISKSLWWILQVSVDYIEFLTGTLVLLQVGKCLIQKIKNAPRSALPLSSSH